MLNIAVDSGNNVIVAEPQGSLTAEDFEGLSACIDQFINEKDVVPALVLNAKEFPIWKDLDSLMAHLKLVREHEKILPKVAIVSDNTVLSVMPSIVNHFVGARIRHFRSDALNEALDWASVIDPPGHSFRLMEGMPDDVVACEVVGKLTSKDYIDFMYPLIEQKLKTHERLKFLVVMDEDFEGATATAIWDDTRLGFSHFHSFSKIALVTDIGWLRNSARLFAPLMPGQVHLFERRDLDGAIAWIKA
ncbi:STAS/SEC14 domain-containing protein [Hoeflea sp. CAU 1731]